MPGPSSPLARLPEAVSQSEILQVEHARDHQVIIDTLLEMTEDLLSFTKRDTLLGKGDPDSDPYTPSLGGLYARLEAGRVPPSPTPVGASPKKRFRFDRRTSKSPAQRALREFEDIYYALLALVQEMHRDLLTRINNGFNHIDDFVCDGSVRIFQLIDYLVKGWNFLNDPSVVKALDDTIRDACYKKTQKKFRDDYKEGKYLPNDYKDLMKALKKDYDEIPGLNWIGGWSPAMINASLQQKWRPVYSAERMDKVKKQAWKKAQETKKRKLAEREERVEREEALKARLQEEIARRQQEEQTKAARATLVSTYMENLRKSASPHARQLVQNTGFDLSPIPFGGLQTSPTDSSLGDQILFFENVSAQNKFSTSSLSSDGKTTSMGSNRQHNYPVSSYQSQYGSPTSRGGYGSSNNHLVNNGGPVGHKAMKPPSHQGFYNNRSFDRNAQTNAYLQVQSTERYGDFQAPPRFHNAGHASNDFQRRPQDARPMESEQNASAYRAQQGFGMDGLVRGNGQVQDGGNGNEKGDVEMGM